MSTSKKHNQLDRVTLVTLGVFAIGILFIGRLGYLQLYLGKSFAIKAEKQYVAPIASTFDRGTVFFQDKIGTLTPAATLKQSFTIAIKPAAITDPEGVYKILNSLIPLDEKTFVEKANKKDDPYEEIAKEITPETTDLIQKKKIPGVMVSGTATRFYPSKDVGAQVVGFVGNNGKELTGQYGVERSYDSVLARGEDAPQVNFFAEVFSDLGDTLHSTVKAKDADVVLTIDPAVQLVVHDALEKLRSQWKSEFAGAIVMDPKTGKIIAMETSPSFDPNEYQDVKDQHVYSNQNVEGVFELGSIFKTLTMASGLDAGVVTPDTHYHDAGSLKLNGRTIRNFDNKGRGYVDMQSVLDNSLNTGAVFVMQQLGTQRFADYFFKLGLNEKTGIDLPGEIRGLVGNLKSKEEVNYATASFGQGIATSPIATIRALAALSNGGYLVNPYVVEGLAYPDGHVEEILRTATTTQVFKPGTSETITRMLVHVVDVALLKGKFKSDDFAVAAKTGTAQIPMKGGGYYPDRYLHSFFGYFPAYNPRFIILLYHTNPKGPDSEYASHTLSDTFFQIEKFLLTYYEVPPDRVHTETAQ